MAHTDRIALVVHGYGLAHGDWLHTMWGDEKAGLMGRIPMAVLVAYRRRPSLIIWNTGASEKDGFREGEYNYRYALEHLSELPRVFPMLEGAYLAGFGAYLASVSVFEHRSMRTSEAIDEAVSYLAPYGKVLFDEVAHVASKNHISRVLRDSMHRWWEMRGLRLQISGYGAETGYAGGTAGEVEINELHTDRQVAYNKERDAAGLNKPR